MPRKPIKPKNSSFFNEAVIDTENRMDLLLEETVFYGNLRANGHTNDKYVMCKEFASKETANKATQSPKKRKPIKGISDKHALRLKAYRIARDKYFIEHSICEARISTNCCSVPVDLHHKKSRGKHLCDVSTFMSVCRPCHTWIHEHPTEALELGFIIKRLDI